MFADLIGFHLNARARLDSTTELLGALEVPPQHRDVIEVIKRSATRMDELVSNILDFARFPDRAILSTFQFGGAVKYDGERIGQLVSNAAHLQRKECGGCPCGWVWGSPSDEHYGDVHLT